MITNPVTVASFPFASEARLARAELHAEGIDCVIPDEHILDVNPDLVNASGGLCVCVDARDAERAHAILSSTVSDEELEAQALSTEPPAGKI